MKIFGIGAKPGRRVAGLAAMLLATVLSAPAMAETVLSYSNWHPPGYVVTKVMMPWIEKVAEVTEGRVRIEVRAAAVGTPKEQADVVRDGLADMALVVPGYTPGRYPLLELSEMPLISVDAAAQAPAFARLFEKYMAPLKPFEGAHVLSAFNVGPFKILSREKPVNTVADLTGLKLYISTRGASALMQSLGTVPVSATSAEMYSLISTGVIDGFLNPFESAISFGVSPYLKHVTVVPNGLGQAGMVLIINEGKWQSISPEDQAAITAIAGDALAQEIGDALMAGEAASRTAMEAEGTTFTELPADQIAILEEHMQPIFADWVEKSKAAGLENAQQVLDEYRAELAITP